MLVSLSTKNLLLTYLNVQQYNPISSRSDFTHERLPLPLRKSLSQLLPQLLKPFTLGHILDSGLDFRAWLRGRPERAVLGIGRREQQGAIRPKSCLLSSMDRQQRLKDTL